MAGMSFKDRWIYSFYTWWCRFRGAPFSLSDARNRPARLLICLPSEPEEARKAAGIIPDLSASLGAEAVFVAGEPRSLACCGLADEVIRRVPLDRTARRWTGLPSAGIVDRLSNEGLSLAVDLNPSAELLPAVLCQRIEAPVRLCLHDPRREGFFNLQILLADEPSAHSHGAGPGIPRIPPDSEPSYPPLAGAAASAGDSPDTPDTPDTPYTRLLRVIQSAVVPPSRPRIST